jgi:hypothetical protein
LYELLYGATPAEFASAYPLAESVQRLSDAVYAPLFVIGGAPQVRGNASERYVSIHRVVPGARNSFRPVFTGAFHEHDGRVVLRGAYSLDDATKLFTTLWLGLCLAMLVAMIAFVFREGALSFVPLVPLALLCFGVFLVWSGKEASRRDPERIAEVIVRALQAPSG